MFGDNFLVRMYRDYVINDGIDLFMVEYFEVSAHCGSHFECNNPNMISRIENSMASVFNKSKRLPIHSYGLG